MGYEIRPLTQGFGAEIFGLDLASGFSDNLAQDLVGAWVDAGSLMVIHDQTLSSEQHIALSRHFGPLFGAKTKARCKTLLAAISILIIQKFTVYQIR